MFEDYTAYGRFAERHGILQLGPTLVASILNEIPEENIRKVAAMLGVGHPRKILAALGQPFTLENVVRLLEDFLGPRAHWFEARITKEKDVWSIHLEHSVGRKWSLFLLEYVNALFKKCGFQRIEPTYINDRSVTLRLRPPVDTSIHEPSEL